MRISFLHLSDFHLNDSKGVHPAKIQAIVDSLGVYTPIEGIVIVLSGDIAATGQANQYKIVATFLKRLIPEIRRKYSISEKNTKILIVPGNHDIDWGRSTRLDSSKIRSFDEKERALHLQQELKSMKNYFSFSDRNGCFFPYWMHIPFGQLVTRKILHFDNGYRIEANLLNTAPFSCDSDDGLHYLPEDAIHSLTTESNADFSLVVMHHSPDWFEFSQKKELENTLSKRCSLAFYGHEHFPGTQNVLYDNGNRIVKQAGGAWWQSSVPTLSDYYAALFDTESRKYFLSKFSWNADRSAFVATMKQGSLAFGKKVTLSRRPDATPNYFYELLNPQDVIKTRRFEDVDTQYDFIAKQIKKNITEDELDPDDILVIFPSVIYAKSQYQRFAQHLARYSISSMLAGVTNERDIFHIPGSISCSAIYRAKGNESPMVYIVNADCCYEGIELIKLRNTLFTAITRSRAWVRICGVGSAMDGLIAEIQRFIDKEYVLDFKIPTKTEMNKLRTINRERSASDTRKIEEAQKGVRTLLDLVAKGELDASQIPEFGSLMKLFLNSKAGGEDIDEEDE